ncbi:MAG TPA: DUF6252 family protein [Bacteroidia bacterium]|jgi:hypothetical protein|nr:DUF6252 family protein [Bacteroidia bacterium]
MRIKPTSLKGSLFVLFCIIFLISCNKESYIQGYGPNNPASSANSNVNNTNGNGNPITQSFTAIISSTTTFTFQATSITASKSSTEITIVGNNTDKFTITLPVNATTGSTYTTTSSMYHPTFSWNSNYVANSSYSNSFGSVTVTSISSSSIIGTFSATLYGLGTGNTITVTNGQFAANL